MFRQVKISNKLIGFIAVIILLVIATIFSSVDTTRIIRYHQHQQIDKSLLVEDATKANTFFSHLPIVSIDTDGRLPSVEYITVDDITISNSNYIDSSVHIYNKKDSYNYIVDTPDFYGKALFKKRGNSSIRFDKPSYTLKFIDEKYQEVKVPFLDMTNDDEWVLHGPFLDKTLIRNYISFNIGGSFMKYTPNVKFFELIINNQYQGLYLAIEDISIADDKIPFSKYSPKYPKGSYLIRFDRPNPLKQSLNLFSKYAEKRQKNSIAEIIYPGKNIIAQDYVQYVEDDFSQLEKTLYSFDYNNPSLGYKTLLDVNSFIDYYIFNEFSLNTDAGIFSTYLFKDDRGKYHIGPIWDFNNAYDNYFADEIPIDSLFMHNRSLYFMLIKDPEFTDRIINRYHRLRRGVLSEENIINYIDELTNWLKEPIERNNEKWGYSFDSSLLNDDNKLFPEERNPVSYDDAIVKLKQNIMARGRWLDENIETIAQFSHPSKAKKYNH